MILVSMNGGDGILYYGSKQQHFIGIDIKNTGGGTSPLDTSLHKVAHVDEG